MHFKYIRISKAHHGVFTDCSLKYSRAQGLLKYNLIHYYLVAFTHALQQTQILLCNYTACLSHTDIHCKYMFILK